MLEGEWVLVRAVSLRKNDEFEIRKHEQSRNTVLLTPLKTQKIHALKELNFLLFYPSMQRNILSHRRL